MGEGESRRALEERLRLFESVVGRATEGVVVTEARLGSGGRTIVYVNEGFCAQTGYEAAEVLGRSPGILLGPESDPAAVERIRQSLVEGRPVTVELAHYRKDGTVFWVENSITQVVDEAGAVTHLVSIQRDITERRAMSRRLAHQASHDHLTALPNRAAFVHRLESSLSRGGRLAVLFIDLDRFKVINDSLGHDAGDRLLIAVANRFADALRPGDVVARFGGDEFVVLCDRIDSVDTAVAVAHRLEKALADPLPLERGEVVLTASTGVALGSPGARADELLRDADAAMYQAKLLGKARIAVFDEEMRTRAVERLVVESDLHGALREGQLVLHFQPAISMETGAVVGVEALVRWQRLGGPLVMPATFIPVAEETGLIVPLGDWVLTEACRQARRWLDQRPGAALLLSVNLSARQLLLPEIADRVDAILRASRLPPSALCLEITESMLMVDAEAAMAAVRRLKEIGVGLSIDDFGTGYSSLAYLKRFPVDEVKVDRSFVAGLGQDPSDEAILVAVVGLARALGLRVVAEGVETPGQLDAVRRLGCDRAQGFLLGRPVPAGEIGLPDPTDAGGVPVASPS